MQPRPAKAQTGSKWAWTRTGALILFLVTGILLVASLHAVKSSQIQVGAGLAGHNLSVIGADR